MVDTKPSDLRELRDCNLHLDLRWRSKTGLESIYLQRGNNTGLYDRDPDGVVVGVGDVHLAVGETDTAGLRELGLVCGAVHMARRAVPKHCESASGDRQYSFYLVIIGVGDIENAFKVSYADGVLQADVMV